MKAKMAKAKMETPAKTSRVMKDATPSIPLAKQFTKPMVKSEKKKSPNAKNLTPSPSPHTKSWPTKMTRAGSGSGWDKYIK
jgi:hypothetical protein